MNPVEFVAKWSRVELKERSAAQQHFLDLCDLLGHGKPAAEDPTGESFTFEKGAAKHGGGDGWADVWKKGVFGWEYKGKHKDLDAAYNQLLLYREALENPPLLVTCDLDRVVVHTNFTNTKSEVHEILLEDVPKPRSLEILRAVFFEPEKLRPGTTSQAITAEAAARIADIAKSLRDRQLEAHEVARFLDRVVFCLFAEDVGLLPNLVFTRMLEKSRYQPEKFSDWCKQLFNAMAGGGSFGIEDIRRFNGNLFQPAPVLTLSGPELEDIFAASKLDWGAIDPSIFGSLFERGLDPDKRSQLGAHYTSREDIETLVEPVVMQPLRREWTEAKRLVENLLATGKKEPTGKEKEPSGPAFKKAREEAVLQVRRLLEHLAHVKVLDPACGSGHFLYVTLQKLKDLEKEAILFAQTHLSASFIPLVGPWQLYGIEINPYAYELAQMTVWIGYLQWIRNNGFGVTEDPVLRPMDTFECKDAILDLSDPEAPKEPQWPRVDFIVGNPPFLGTKKLRERLGDEYVDKLFAHYGQRIPNFSDLCCYWFEKARAAVAGARCQRAGLLATQGIRGGLNRKVLERIIETGGLFWAVADRAWILDGANVHVSLVAFDDGTERLRLLDGRVVARINANLTAAADTTLATQLREDSGLGFVADVKAGRFDVSDQEALSLLLEPNPNGRPTSDVLLPWVNGLDVLRRPRNTWIIDFLGDASEAVASEYQSAFAIARLRVLPERSKVKRAKYRKLWWLHAEPCLEMRAALRPLERFLVTPTVAKHRVFSWLTPPTLPDHQLIAIARDDDYTFGVLHSRAHEVWALKQGTRLETRPRYTPTTCLETFPFPRPSPNQQEDISDAAKHLDERRQAWLNPVEWVRVETLEFPGAVDGAWKRLVTAPEAERMGIVSYSRVVPRDADCAAHLSKRTVTNLYNERPAWLDLAHKRLDEAVFAAYGWDQEISDEEILEKLLALNLERSARETR